MVTNADFPLVRFPCIHLRAISWWVPKLLFGIMMNLKITLSKSVSHLTGANNIQPDTWTQSLMVLHTAYHCRKICWCSFHFPSSVIGDSYGVSMFQEEIAKAWWGQSGIYCNIEWYHCTLITHPVNHHIQVMNINQFTMYSEVSIHHIQPGLITVQSIIDFL